MRINFLIHEKRLDGTENLRFHKVRYTAALRLGIVLRPYRGKIELEFEGEITKDVKAHEGNLAYSGTISIANEKFPDLIVIAKERSDRRFDLVTFWPRSQHPDAHKSYTDPLVDTAMDGTPFPLEVVATTMHAAFIENAGASPATLMKMIYERENESLKELAAVYSQQMEVQQEELIQEREARKAAEADVDRTKAELEILRKQSARVAPSGTTVTPSNIAVLQKVTEGTRGSKNQPAILLHMSDGTIRANNWLNGYQARLNYARKLVGRRIKTDVWGNYSWKEWFQNIYPVDD